MSTTITNDKLSFIQSINPANRLAEKRKFLFDPLYNPQFTYSQPLDMEDLQEYSSASDEYLSQAVAILDAVLAKWGTESKFLDDVEGKMLNREELTTVIRSYLKTNGLEGKIRIQFLSHAASMASMVGDTLNIRLPVAHREKRSIGMLDHEIGTHYFRRINEEQQPWYKQKSSFHMHGYLETEEGLAAINSMMYTDQPYLWFPALYYYLGYHAQRMSFSELNALLRKYVDDKERRWSMCLRVKRGQSDTSMPGTFSKDQVYLRGLNKIVKWLAANDYNPTPLYIGKIAVEDLEKTQALSPNYQPIVPTFLQGSLVSYKDKVEKIVALNMLGETKKRSVPAKAEKTAREK